MPSGQQHELYSTKVYAVVLGHKCCFESMIRICQKVPILAGM